MSKQTIALGLIALGVLIAAVALAADVLGFGDSAGIGLQQSIGIGVGAVLAIAGILLALIKPKTT